MEPVQSIQPIHHAPIGAPEEPTAIQSQVATAKRYPRDLTRVKQQINAMLADSQVAASCVYDRPVGKDKTGNVIRARGMSIRMAELLASSWGNLRFGSQIVDLTPTHVTARAFAWDLETNVSAATETRESCVDAAGRPFGERQRMVIAKAAAKKALRDAILSVIPRAVSEPVYRRCLEILAAKSRVRPTAEDIASIRAELAALNVTDERALAALGVQGWDQATMAHIAQLRATLAAIEAEETTPEIAFPDHTGAPAAVAQNQEQQAPQQPEAQQSARVAMLRKHIANARLTEAEWLKAAVDIGVAGPQDTLESLAASKWDQIFEAAAQIRRKAKENRT